MRREPQIADETQLEIRDVHAGTQPASFITVDVAVASTPLTGTTRSSVSPAGYGRSITRAGSLPHKQG
jgi:hypothetical protein